MILIIQEVIFNVALTKIIFKKCQTIINGIKSIISFNKFQKEKYLICKSVKFVEFFNQCFFHFDKYFDNILFIFGIYYINLTF